jgi:hypothetical protein
MTPEQIEQWRMLANVRADLIADTDAHVDWYRTRDAEFARLVRDAALDEARAAIVEDLLLDSGAITAIDALKARTT